MLKIVGLTSIPIDVEVEFSNACSVDARQE